MKVTFDLPPDLARQLKLRAVHEGRKIKDVAADVLRAGLTAEPSPPLATPTIGRDERTGLPVILGGRPAKPGEELTAERIAEILIEQEAECARGAR
jgi:plasmid stability protein